MCNVCAYGSHDTECNDSHTHCTGTHHTRPTRGPHAALPATASRRRRTITSPNKLVHRSPHYTEKLFLDVSLLHCTVGVLYCSSSNSKKRGTATALHVFTSVKDLLFTEVNTCNEGNGVVRSARLFAEVYSHTPIL